MVRAAHPKMARRCVLHHPELKRKKKDRLGVYKNKRSWGGSLILTLT
jgi:hypothetical protein